MAIDVSQDRLAGTWIFNGMHSAATFAVASVVADYRARFDELDASLVDGGLSGEVKVASLVLSEEHGFRAHVMSPQFFDVERHPTISFASTALELDGDRVELDGELTINGIAKPVHATGTVGGPTDDPFGHTLLGFTLETTIDRTDYGMRWNADLPGGGRMLGDEVTLELVLEFMKA